MRVFASCIWQQLPRNYGGFREPDHIAQHVKIPSCRRDAGEMREKVRVFPGLDRAFCPLVFARIRERRKF